MMSRWADSLSDSTTRFLLQNRLRHSTSTGQGFVRYPHWKRFLLKVSALWFDPSTHEATRRTCIQFRGLRFKGGRAIFDGKSQVDAREWLSRQTNDPGYSRRFAEMWARRWQGQASPRTTWQLVNAIFFTSGSLPRPRDLPKPLPRPNDLGPDRRFRQRPLDGRDPWAEAYGNADEASAYEAGDDDEKFCWFDYDEIDRRNGWTEP
jgi:hypothetical protein